ncbi:MAG: Type 1 glutamine amidotransferase-like domain-containing protein [bacterium]
MKLLLTSNGFIGSSLEKDFLDMTGGKTNLRVAFVPTASDPIEWVPESVDSKKYIAKIIGENKFGASQEYLYFKNNGYDVVVADLKEYSDVLKEKLQNADIIYVCGGDVNYLLDWAKKSKLDTYLKNLLDRGVLYVGTSAGSGLLCPDIGLTWWEPGDPTDHTGLGIVDFIIVPHQKEGDARSNTKNLIERKKYMQSVTDFPWKVYVLQDGQAIKIDDDKIEHIGQGMRKCL